MIVFGARIGFPGFVSLVVGTISKALRFNIGY